MESTKSPLRIGRVIYNDGLERSKSEAVGDLIKMILEQPTTKTVEVWISETNSLGVQVFDDGMYLTGFFDMKTGNLLGDWF